MNRQLMEAEKNYLVCSILMIIVGVVLCIINKVGLGVCSIVIGIVFLIVFFAMVKKNNEEEKSKASGKDNE